MATSKVVSEEKSCAHFSFDNASEVKIGRDVSGAKES
jgi:hypothetical protein